MRKLNLRPASTAWLTRLQTARFQPSFVEIMAAPRMFVAPISRIRATVRPQSP
jgi:hypothetical protein